MWIEFRRHIPTTLKFNWVSAEPLEVSRTHLPKHIPNLFLHIPSYSCLVSTSISPSPISLLCCIISGARSSHDFADLVNVLVVPVFHVQSPYLRICQSVNLNDPFWSDLTRLKPSNPEKKKKKKERAQVILDLFPSQLEQDYALPDRVSVLFNSSYGPCISCHVQTLPSVRSPSLSM